MKFYSLILSTIYLNWMIQFVFETFSSIHVNLHDAEVAKKKKYSKFFAKRRTFAFDCFILDLILHSVFFKRSRQ